MPTDNDYNNDKHQLSFSNNNHFNISPGNIEVDSDSSNSAAARNCDHYIIKTDEDVDNTINRQQTTIPTSNTISDINTLLINITLRQMRKSLRYVSTWKILLGYLSLHYRVTFTKDQYKLFATQVNTPSIDVHPVNSIASSPCKPISLIIFASIGVPFIM